MNTASVVASVLVLAVLLGVWRGRRPVPAILQAVVALLLYLSLFPPSLRENFAAGELVVLTPGATEAQVAALPWAPDLVALPGVVADRSVERVPDLGTALRRHPDARQLRIVGGGLPARDRDAARGLVAVFDAAPLPRGLVELDVPASVLAGHVWRIRGRVEAAPEARVELRDPSGAVVATQAPDAQGRFELVATAKGEGTARFALHVLDRAGARIDTAEVPLATRAGQPLKILLLAGAPDPELKYLRRWAADAGIALDSRIALTDGVALTEGRLAFDAGALGGADLAIVDERAWAALDAQRKQALRDAVREGLGLLLRVTGPVPDAVAADWSGLGLSLRAADASPPVVLDRTLGLADSGLAFARRAVEVESSEAAALLRADDGSVMAWSLGAGRGRIVLWRLADSYRLALGGEPAAFGTLWSDLFAAVARARGDLAPTRPDTARVDERAVFCGLAAGAEVEAASGARTALSLDAGRCAAFWPAAAGWHTLSSGGSRWPFHVRARDESLSLAVAETARATRALVRVPASDTAASVRERPMPRWPFFLAWLVASGILWWVERASRDGRRSRTARA